MNPIQTKLIPSHFKNQDLLKITQVEKYSPYRESDEGRIFEMNNFGSFNQINQEFERFQDSGEAKTRPHSGFGGKLVTEQQKASDVFDSAKIISELPDSYGFHIEAEERMNLELKQEMIKQEKLAKKILDAYTIQARW